MVLNASSHSIGVSRFAVRTALANFFFAIMTAKSFWYAAKGAGEGSLFRLFGVEHDVDVVGALLLEAGLVKIYRGNMALVIDAWPDFIKEYHLPIEFEFTHGYVVGGKTTT